MEDRQAFMFAGGVRWRSLPRLHIANSQSLRYSCNQAVKYLNKISARIKMTKQVTIDLDDEVLVFLDRHSGGNRSEYINKVNFVVRS